LLSVRQNVIRARSLRAFTEQLRDCSYNQITLSPFDVRGGTVLVGMTLHAQTYRDPPFDVQQGTVLVGMMIQSWLNVEGASASTTSETNDVDVTASTVPKAVDVYVEQTLSSNRTHWWFNRTLSCSTIFTRAQPHTLALQHTLAQQPPTCDITNAYVTTHTYLRHHSPFTALHLTLSDRHELGTAPPAPYTHTLAPPSHTV
jgi:hypothetical protein